MYNSYSRGNVLLITLVFLGIFVTSGTALLSYLTTYAQSERIIAAGVQARVLAEAGIDKAIYELNQNPSYTGETNTALGAGTFTIAVTAADSITKAISATAYVPDSVHPIARKTVRVLATIDSAVVSFRFGVQVGNGGVTMGNGAQINGNIYANGSITGSGGSNGVPVITGDATATGVHTISGVQVNGSAWAHTLSDCQIDGNATYQTLSNCSVGGTKTVSVTDPTPADMPINDAQITNWESIATAGGVINGDYTVSNSQQLGPKEIDGNLTVTGTLILAGPVWVKGNITFNNNSSLSVAASIGKNGAVLIADYPGSEATQGTVLLSNNMTISGNGNVGSFPMVLSTNTGSASITLNNNANSVILYAPYGTIAVGNNAQANQITAHSLVLNNGVEINYVNGLVSQSFSSGPGGSWTFATGTYEIQP